MRSAFPIYVGAIKQRQIRCEVCKAKTSHACIQCSVVSGDVCAVCDNSRCMNRHAEYYVIEE